MPIWLSEGEYSILEAICARLIPDDAEHPGAIEAGVPDYIDTLLGAFCFEPPRIWAGAPMSGRFGGEPGFDRFLTLNALDELAWRTRIEGSLGDPRREFNGPVIGLQERYRRGLADAGNAFVDLCDEDQDRWLEAHKEFTTLVHGHACEGMYGAPEYGGNREQVGWRSIGFDGDVQPRGWSDDEVANR